VGLLAALLSIGAVGAVLGGTQAGRYFVVFALLGYVMGRRKPASPLDHFVRGRLYQVISENPGIHFSELRRRANVSNGSASHHLHVLQRAGLVRPLVDRTLTRFYPTDRPLDDESYGLSESDRAVLAAVEGSPGLTETQISQQIDRSLSVVSRSVDRLGALGHIRTEQSGRVVSVFPRPAPDAGIGEPSPPGPTS
jgi:predicted transcriptional regulator